MTARARGRLGGRPKKLDNKKTLTANGTPIKDIAKMWGDFSYHGLPLFRKVEVGRIGKNGLSKQTDSLFTLDVIFFQF